MSRLLTSRSAQGKITPQRRKLHHGGEIQLAAGGNQGSGKVGAGHMPALGAASGQGEGGGASAHPQRGREGEAEGATVEEGPAGLKTKGAGGERGKIVNELAGGHGWIHRAQFSLCSQLLTPGHIGIHLGGEKECLSRELAKGAAGVAAQKRLLLVEVTGPEGDAGEGSRTPGEAQTFKHLGIVEGRGRKSLGTSHGEP